MDIAQPTQSGLYSKTAMRVRKMGYKTSTSKPLVSSRIPLLLPVFLSARRSVHVACTQHRSCVLPASTNCTANRTPFSLSNSIKFHSSQPPAPPTNTYCGNFSGASKETGTCNQLQCWMDETSRGRFIQTPSLQACVRERDRFQAYLTTLLRLVWSL